MNFFVCGVYFSVQSAPCHRSEDVSVVMGMGMGESMEAFKLELSKIDSMLEHLNFLAKDLRPRKRELRWFADRRSRLAKGRVRKSTQDALNHAAALIGYFDGVEARGSFQLRTGSHSSTRPATSLFQLLDYLEWVIAEVQGVIRSLLARNPLQMCEKGPKKPGPSRTAQVCLSHLASLYRVYCLLFLDLSASDQLKEKIERHLEVDLPSQLLEQSS